MPRGHPDWQVNTEQFSFGDLDTAEAMVRIGSPNVYTRSGRVVYIDGFEDNLSPWVLSGSGAGYAVALATDRVMHGSRSAKLTPGSDASKSAAMLKRFPLVRSANMGLEILFSLEASVSLLGFVWQVYSDGEVYSYTFFATPNTGKLEIGAVPAGTKYMVATIDSLRSANPIWFLLKAVVDPVTHYWKSLQVNNRKWDLSTHPGVFVVGGGMDQVLVQYYVVDDSGTQSPGWLDSFILTIDEP